jgi:hypothetical protein
MTRAPDDCFRVPQAKHGRANTSAVRKVRRGNENRRPGAPVNMQVVVEPGSKRNSPIAVTFVERDFNRARRSD